VKKKKSGSSRPPVRRPILAPCSRPFAAASPHTTLYSRPCIGLFSSTLVTALLRPPALIQTICVEKKVLTPPCPQSLLLPYCESLNTQCAHSVHSPPITFAGQESVH